MTRVELEIKIQDLHREMLIEWALNKLYERIRSDTRLGDEPVSFKSESSFSLEAVDKQKMNMEELFA